MFGGKFQNVWREAKKWQRRVASFFVDRIPYGKLRPKRAAEGVATPSQGVRDSRDSGLKIHGPYG